jgi:hypothetical protein
MDEAARVLETVEYLCSIELELARLGAPAASGART